jgi:hypothetical protein
MNGEAMSSPDPDLAVKTIVAELASFHADDVKAILDALHPDERQTIESFLHAHAGRFDIAAAAAGMALDYDETGLSIWLRQLLEKIKQQRSTMTPVAQQALLRSVVTCVSPVRS